MSLRPPLAAPTLAIAAEFQGRFVRDAHILVAEGYSRLAPATLAKKSEEVISGAIVQHAEDWLADPSAPVSWVQAERSSVARTARRDPSTRLNVAHTYANGATRSDDGQRT